MMDERIKAGTQSSGKITIRHHYGRACMTDESKSGKNGSSVSLDIDIYSL
jgi:hypothetical protein